MQEIFRAPLLSATWRMVRIWIMSSSSLLGAGRRGRCPGLGHGQLSRALDDLGHPPALAPRERPRLLDPHAVAGARAELVVSHEGRGPANGLLVEAVAHQPLDRHHHRLLHLGGGDQAYALLAPA